jgi:hypothetical protein
LGEDELAVLADLFHSQAREQLLQAFRLAPEDGRGWGIAARRSHVRNRVRRQPLRSLRAVGATAYVHVRHRLSRPTVICTRQGSSDSVVDELDSIPFIRYSVVKTGRSGRLGRVRQYMGWLWPDRVQSTSEPTVLVYVNDQPACSGIDVDEHEPGPLVDLMFPCDAAVTAT